MKLKVFLLISRDFLRKKSVTNAQRIYHLKWKDSSMQHILVHDKVVVFWIFIQFQLTQSNHVQ